LSPCLVPCSSSSPNFFPFRAFVSVRSFGGELPMPYFLSRHLSLSPNSFHFSPCFFFPPENSLTPSFSGRSFGKSNHTPFSWPRRELKPDELGCPPHADPFPFFSPYPCVTSIDLFRDCCVYIPPMQTFFYTWKSRVEGVFCFFVPPLLLFPFLCP